MTHIDYVKPQTFRRPRGPRHSHNTRGCNVSNHPLVSFSRLQGLIIGQYRPDCRDLPGFFPFQRHHRPTGRPGFHTRCSPSAGFLNLLTEIPSKTAHGFIPPRRHSEGWGLQSFTHGRYGYRFQILAPPPLPVLHGFLPDIAGGTTRPTEGFYPRSISSISSTLLFENSRLPSWT
jgi:hypothetical protein